MLDLSQILHFGEKLVLIRHQRMTKKVLKPMKKHFAALFITIFTTVMFSAAASAVPLRFQEGVHYKVIGDTPTATPTVTEYFSYFCGHCYRFEMVAKELEKGLPDGAKFKKSHVDFVSRTPKDIQFALTKAVVIGKKLNLSHKFNDVIFKSIHQERKQFTSEAEVVDLLVSVGADKKKVESLMKSFGVKNAAKKMKTMQDDLSSRQILTSVPMFVINGKYKVIGDKLKSMDDYTSLVDYLLAMK